MKLSSNKEALKIPLISLYHENRVALQAERGVTLGLLKLIYSSDASNCGILLGVKPRKGDTNNVQRLITSDTSTLDEDEYDLIVKVLSKTPNAPGSTASPVEETPGITVPVVHPRPSVARSGTEEPRVLTTLCNVAEAHKAADAAASLAALSASALVDPMLYQTPGPSQPSDAGKAKENSLSVSAYSMVAVTSTAPVSDRVSSTATTTLAVTATVPAAPVSVPLGNSANAALQDETVTGSTDGIIDTSKFPYHCDHCHIPFKSKSKFIVHQRRHTEENPYLCTYCGDSFKFYEELCKHRDELHLCNKTFKCEHCPRSFSTRKELKVHTWRHTGEKSFKCDICGKEYSHQGNLSLHIQKHKGIRPYKCPLCPKTFPTKNSMESHIRYHTGEKPYKCRYCELSFRTNANVRSHEKSHSDYRAYKCSKCDKAFKFCSQRTRHELTHNPEFRPFKCHICSKGFQASTNLRYHMITHESKTKRLVKCPYCPKRICAGKVLAVHLRLQHAKEHNLSPEQRLAIVKNLIPNEEETERYLAEEAVVVRRGKFECPECSKKFQTMGGIKKHLSCEHPGRTLTDEENQKLSQHQDAQTENCKFCKKALKTHRKLVSHMLLEHPLQAKEMGLSADQLKKARKAKSKERKQRSKFKICAICGEAFHLTQTLRRHMETEHGQTDGNDKDNDREHGEKKGGLQIMQLDGKEKERVNTSKQKRKYSLKRKPVTCELCNKVFMRPRMLDNHLVLYHGKEPAASEEQAIGDGVSVERNKEISSAFKGKNCEKCGKVFKFMKSLVKHVSYCKGKKAEDANPRSYHFKVARVNCGVCGKEFARPKFLAYHLRYEHSVDPLEPRVVDESENKEGTEGKSKKGAGESVKKLKCWFCEEIFDASDSVVEHMRNFHGVTSKDTDVSSAAKSSTLTFYKCSFDGCGKKLRGRNILTRHLKYGHSIDPKTIDIDKLVVSEPLKNKDAGKAFVTKSVMVTKRKSAPKKSAAKHDATANASKTPSASKPTAVSAISSLQSLCNSVGESEDRIAHARPLRTAKLRASVNPNPFIAGLEQLTANIREEEAVVRQSGRTRGGIPQTPSLHPSYIVNSQAVAGQPVMDLPSSVPYGYSTSALPSRQRNTRRSTQLATRQSRLAQDVNTSELAPPPPGYSYAFVPVLVPTSEAEVVPSRQEMPRRNNRNSRQRYLETELVHDQERAEERGQQTVKSNSSRKRKPRKITKVSKVKKEMKDKRSSCMFSSRSSEEDSDVDNELELIITLTDRETEHLDRTESRKDQDRNGEDNCQRSNTPQLDTDNAKDSQTKSITTVKISPIKKEEPEV